MPTEYGPGGYDPTKPNNNVVSSTPDPPYVPFSNTQTIRQRAEAALTANASFIGAAKPGTAAAQASAAYDQTVRVTRECSALIRLTLGLLDDISGT